MQLVESIFINIELLLITMIRNRLREPDIGRALSWPRWAHAPARTQRSNTAIETPRPGLGALRECSLLLYQRFGNGVVANINEAIVVPCRLPLLHDELSRRVARWW